MPGPAEVARAYTAAKSAGDLVVAMNLCHQHVIVDSIPMRMTCRGRAQARERAAAFHRAFPDHDIAMREVRQSDDLAVGHGTITGTMEAPLLGLGPTGRRFRLPFACLWYVSKGLIRRERMHFDLNHMCEQLGLATGEFAAALRTWQ